MSENITTIKDSLNISGKISQASPIKMQYVDERLCETEKGIVLEEFIDDLYAILDGFCRDYGRDKFVFRIYQVLSAGDFAVAVKSRYPETSFELSSRIRSRVAGIKEKDGKIQASQWHYTRHIRYLRWSSI